MTVCVHEADAAMTALFQEEVEAMIGSDKEEVEDVIDFVPTEVEAMIGSDKEEAEDVIDL